jgi:outer membrane protein assembly factor BamD
MNKSVIVLIISLAFVLSGCSHKNKVENPLANLDSKQPDKVLFDRASDALQHRQYDVARLTFQTLINTYPDSEYIARAKLGVADSWYAEGNTAAMAQAEAEYKDFQTFFPNMPEAAEAQFKVAGIHYKQMLKPDRDYTHAKRAEDEYRQLIQSYPDSKLVADAKQRLREVQEVLGEREFGIGKFYYGRESYAAAVARLKTLADQYPLYSGADEALYMLGDAYERQVANLKAATTASVAQERLIGELHKRAADAYSRIVTRYPVTDRAADARERLKNLSFPVPEPTAEAIAQNKAEEESRSEMGTMARLMSNFKARPDIASAAKAGEPVMEDHQQTNAAQYVHEMGEVLKGTASSTATIEQVKPGDVQPNEATPRSDSGDSTLPSTKPGDANQHGQSTDTTLQQPAAPPEQVNEANGTKTTPEASTDPKSTNEQSSSKKKKKKKLGIF